MKHVIRLIPLLLLMFCHIPAEAATTLLPPGMQCFTDANGAIISGSVNMFYPATTTPKPNWQDNLQAALNTQPIQLDANGCATIYGVGSYRQQLYDGPVVGGVTTGNLIFDKLTTDTSAFNSVFWSGTAGGTPNVITIIDTGFNATDGTVINFTALATNTGSTTINPSGYGAITVEKDTSGGPVSLTGGEITQNNIISVIYRASDNAFHLLNAAIPSVSGTTAPLCGFTGLKIVNGGSPSTTVNITSTKAVMVNSSGIVINRTSVSVTANTTIGSVTSTAGGLDGEAIVAASWLYVWVIDNGSAPSALLSIATGNGLTPNLPSGYNYICRAGAIRVDGSSNLLRTLQYGTRAQYTVTGGTNTAAAPIMASGPAGNPLVGPVFVALPVATFIPPTATIIDGFITIGTGNTNMMAAPNNQYGVVTSTSNAPPAGLSNASTGNSLPFSFVLESANIYWANNGASNYIATVGWRDSVNAN